MLGMRSLLNAEMSLTGGLGTRAPAQTDEHAERADGQGRKQAHPAPEIAAEKRAHRSRPPDEETHRPVHPAQQAIGGQREVWGLGGPIAVRDRFHADARSRYCAGNRRVALITADLFAALLGQRDIEH